MPKKYLTKIDKAFKRVNSEYALNHARKQMEAAWFNVHRQNVISTLPKRLAVKFDSFDFTDFEQYNDGLSIFINGKAGVGKTVMSAYLYVEYIHQLYLKLGGISSITYNYVVFPSFIDVMQNKINEREINHTDLVKTYSNCDVLVLDDFGIKKITDYVYSLTYMIINERYLNLRPTIINSNHSLSELGVLFEDDRIIRRIEEDYFLIEKLSYKK